jgi:RND family efflux transporter MFP subunit
MRNPKMIVTLLAFVFLAACSSGEKKAEFLQKSDPPVIVTTALPFSNETGSSNISGQVESSQAANISTRVMGYITKLTVKVGDHVNAGQLIASISNNDIIAKRSQVDASITEAEAALKSAQKDLDRFTALYKQQSATAKELDNTTLQYNATKAKVEAAKQMRNEVNAMLAYTSLTAPFAGTVTQKFADAGNMANPGMPIVTIEQSGTYQVSASVPETEISQIKLGESVNVSIRSINRSFNGKITQINPSSQFTGGQYIIKISIPDNDKKGLYAGMYANIGISAVANPTNHTEGNAVLVPVSAIVNKEQLTGLYTVSSNNTALLRWVRLGKTYGEKVEVISGLDKNESFIVSAEGKLYNSAPVSIRK